MAFCLMEQVLDEVSTASRKQKRDQASMIDVSEMNYHDVETDEGSLSMTCAADVTSHAASMKTKTFETKLVRFLWMYTRGNRH